MATSLIDISRKETVEELTKDSYQLNKEIKVDEVTISLLKKRLIVAENTLKDH